MFYSTSTRVLFGFDWRLRWDVPSPPTLAMHQRRSGESWWIPPPLRLWLLRASLTAASSPETLHPFPSTRAHLFRSCEPVPVKHGTRTGRLAHPCQSIRSPTRLLVTYRRLKEWVGTSASLSQLSFISASQLRVACQFFSLTSFTWQQLTWWWGGLPISQEPWLLRRCQSNSSLLLMYCQTLTIGLIYSERGVPAPVLFLV